MSELERKFQSGVDRLAKATRGRFHWDDEGMKDFEAGWEEFIPGQKVEVLTKRGWSSGRVKEGYRDNERGIIVECDEPWKDETGLVGRDVFVPVYCNTRRGIWSMLRGLPTFVEELNPKDSK